MSVKKKRTIGPCRGVTWLYYVVLLWSRDFFLSLYLDPRFRPLLLKFDLQGNAVEGLGYCSESSRKDDSRHSETIADRRDTVMKSPVKQ